MAPLISVVMPVYNAGPYLRPAVQSILDQTLADFELILTDDGSEDDSLRIAQEFAQRDARVKVIQLSHVGVTPALNVGVQQAAGQLIARMDADDIALPQRFEKQVAFLNEHPEVCAVGCWTIDMDPDGDPIQVVRWEASHDEIDAQLLRGIRGLSHPGAMIRTSAMRAVGGYREKFRYTQDKDLWLRLAEHGKLANLPEVLLHQRVHPGSVGVARRQEQADALREVLVDAYHRRGLDRELPDTTQAPAQFSSHQWHTRWAMLAFLNGFTRSARKHARKAVRLKPLSWQSWRVLRFAYWGRIFDPLTKLATCGRRRSTRVL